MSSTKKQIKFDLILNKNTVRTINDLDDNMCIDILRYLKNGLLTKWLLPQDLDLASEIQRINLGQSDRDLFVEVLECFNFEVDEQIIDELFCDENKDDSPICSRRTINFRIKNNHHRHVIDQFKSIFNSIKA